MTKYISILGTGCVASRLATLFLASGHRVALASRAPERGGKNLPAGATLVALPACAVRAEVVVVAVPWVAADGASALDALRSAEPGAATMIVDATNPLQADWSPLAVAGHASAGEAMQTAFPQHRVVKMFNTIFADAMIGADLRAEGVPAFLAGNDAGARNTAASLARDCGLLPIDCGDMIAARWLEGMAHLNIRIAMAGGGTRAAFSYVKLPRA